MKESELRKIAECALCGEKIGACGIPMFWRVTVERYAVNMQAVSRQHGLAMMLGSAPLAAVMGPDEEMAHSIHRRELTVCEACCTKLTCVAALAE